MGIRRNGNLEKKSLQGFSRRNGNSKKWESFPWSCTLTQNGNLTDPRVYASRLKKTVCSVLEKILSGREQITISDSLRTDLKPAAYLNLNFSNVQIWRKPNDGLVYGQTDPIVSNANYLFFALGDTPVDMNSRAMRCMISLWAFLQEMYLLSLG